MFDSVQPPLAEWLALADVYHRCAAVVGWNRAIEIGMLVWEKKRPPSRKFGRMYGRWGVLYVPEAVKPEHEIVRFAGMADAMRLSKVFSGEQLRFPCVELASFPRRNKAIAEQVRSGGRIAAIAASFDMTERQVRRICAAQRDYATLKTGHANNAN